MESRAGLLGRKLTLLRDVLAETERQQGFIAAGDVEGLLQSLAARQAAMDAVDALDGHIAALPDGEDDELAGQIHGLLGRIVGLDDENRRNAAGMAKGLTSGFREISAQRSMMAYGQAVDRGGRFVDKEG